MEEKALDFIGKFGEPIKKIGGKTVSISIAYEHLGLEINFMTK